MKLRHIIAFASALLVATGSGCLRANMTDDERMYSILGQPLFYSDEQTMWAHLRLARKWVDSEEKSGISSFSDGVGGIISVYPDGNYLYSYPHIYR